mmetsp:Transcript_54508/g.90360  ORF Transcript_54508/g.90360 Transcript_54508/m.90360 type:complete len:528 (+) Transcript_54508:117-1700(+)
MQMQQSSLSNQNKRGRKRNAANLLSTDGDGDNINNPRAAKRARIKGKHDQLVKDILRLPTEKINELPEPLRSRALALRAQHDASPVDNHRNSNTAEDANLRPPSYNEFLQQPDHDDDANDNEEEEEEDVSNFLDHDVDSGAETDDPDVDGLHFSMAPRSSNNAYAPPQPSHHSYVAQPMHTEENGAMHGHNNHNRNTTQSIVAAARQPLASAPQQFQTRSTSQSCAPNPQYRPYPYPMMHSSDAVPVQAQLMQSAAAPPPPLPKAMASMHSAYFNDDRDGSDVLLQTQASPQQSSDGRCSCLRWSLFWWALFACFMFLLFEPSLMASPMRYCDSHSSRIAAAFHNRSECEQCPFDAANNTNDGFCMNGTAVCRNKNEWFDPWHQECAERDFMAFLWYRLRMIGYRGVELMRVALDAAQTFWTHEVSEWTTVKAWQTWWTQLQTMSFKELCKQHEMEVVLSFFFLSWHMPMCRLMIVSFWSRMVLAILDEDMKEEKSEEMWRLVIAIQLLSYITPAVVVHSVWNHLFS